MVKNLVAEGLGTALLLVGVVGSGIMADQLTDDIALALLANAIATGCTLYVIITVLGPVSGAHFNPVVSLAFALRARQMMTFPLPHEIPADVLENSRFAAAVPASREYARRMAREQAAK